MNLPYPEHPPSPKHISDPRVIRWNEEGHVICPVCRCRSTAEIMVELKVPEFEGRPGYGRYAGCPACEWRSPLDVFEGVYEE